jgi:hypothetical protein
MIAERRFHALGGFRLINGVTGMWESAKRRSPISRLIGTYRTVNGSVVGQ